MDKLKPTPIQKTAPASVVVATETLPANHASNPSDITALLSQAIEMKVDADQLERLVALHERVTQADARKQFVAALAAFQAECPKIGKTGRNKGITRDGAKDGSPYARLEEDIQPTIHPVLARNHLTYSFDTQTNADVVSATVTITHIAGYSTTSTFSGETDSRNNPVNSRIQKVGAAMTYAKRMALINALGLRVGEVDVDGQSEKPGVPIGDAQFEELNKDIEDTGANLPGMLAHFGIKHLSELTTDDYGRAKEILNLRRQKL